MSAPDREPTQDELLAMAYADGELAPAERRAFEERIAREPLLAREVTELRELDVLARHASPPEPADHEWERIARSPSQRTLLPLAWTLIVVATIVLAGWILWTECTCGLELVPKLAVIALTAGLLLLAGLALRNRLRTLPYDPYTKVKR
jgi:anti-sigma factor RsiW